MNVQSPAIRSAEHRPAPPTSSASARRRASRGVVQTPRAKWSSGISSERTRAEQQWRIGSDCSFSQVRTRSRRVRRGRQHLRRERGRGPANRRPSGTNNLVLGNYFGTNASGARFTTLPNCLLTPRRTRSANSRRGRQCVRLEHRGCPSVHRSRSDEQRFARQFHRHRRHVANLGNPIGVNIDSADNTVGGATAAPETSSARAARRGFRSPGRARRTTSCSATSSARIRRASLRSATALVCSPAVAADNSIGGTSAGAGNVISGNVSAGIELAGGSVSGTDILGNRIGTDPSGTHAVTRADLTDPLMALQNAGVVIIGSVGNIVGGTTPQAGNLISGNYVGAMLATITGARQPQ